MRRVLMTADTVGGVWAHALDLARGLGGLGVQVCLATMGRLPSTAQRHEARGVPGLELYESDFRLEWMDDCWSDVERAGEWLLSLERELSPDVLHLNGYAHAWLPWSRPKIVVGHSCVTSWWRAVFREDPPVRYERYRREVARGLDAADEVVAPTAAMLSALGACYGLRSPARVVPNGVWLEELRRAPKRPEILSAGRIWDQAKNIDALASIAPRLPWPVCVAGDGSTRDLPAGVRALGVLSRRETWDAMSRAAIFAHPARYEPFGLAPLEAAASGCALVLGDLPSLREVWGDAAEYVAPEDGAALEQVLLELIEDHPRRERMAARARRRARRFHAEPMAFAYLGIYRSLLEDRATDRFDRDQRVTV